MKQTILFFLGLTAIVALSSCGAAKQYFQVNQSYYEPAILNKSSQITTIQIIVSDVDSGVVFSSLVFRNLEIPVTAEQMEDGRIKIRGYIQIGGKLLEDQYQKLREEPDRLYFIVGKSRKFIPLKEVERKVTRFPGL